MADAEVGATVLLDEDGEAPTASSSAIDWSALLKVADDPEIAELLESPIENAVRILKEGRDVAKLGVIRGLADLLASEGEEVLEKVFPLLQKLLRDEKSNLDIQCEAAVTFRALLANQRLVERFAGLSEVLLDTLLQNVQQQKDNLSAAAWLETVVEVAESLPLSALRNSIVPLALRQAEPSQRVQRRLVATKLVHRLAQLLPASDVRKELSQCTQMLCHDPNANVRASISQRLSSLAEAFQNSSESVAVLLPCFVELSRDEDAGVREAVLNSLAPSLPHLSAESKKTTVLPMVKRCTEQSLLLKDESLPVVARNLGEWAHSLRAVMTKTDEVWVLNSFVRLVDASQPSTSENEKSTAATALLTQTRRMCAFNVPCMVFLFKEQFKERLLPVLESLSSDSDEEVRSAVAAGFHEIASLVRKEPAIIPPFMELIRSGAPEVVAKLTLHLDKTLPLLYECTKLEDREP